MKKGLEVDKAKQFLADLVKRDSELLRLFTIANLYGYSMRIDIVEAKPCSAKYAKKTRRQ